MKAAIAIIRRDLREKRFIFGAAIVFSLIPFFCLIVPALRREPRVFVSIFSNVLAFNYPIAVALGLGVTMIGSDLTAGRLSFYFSRPISPRSLWYGKFIAALITIYISLVIVVTPGAIYAFNERQWMDSRTVVLTSLLAAPALLLLAHVVSTMIRSRSAWIAVDAAGFAITVVAVRAIINPLMDALAMSLLVAVLAAMSATLIVALILAGAWQLSRGRTDRLANHIELSKFLWSAIAGILIVTAGFIFWATRATPGELTRSATYPAPAGDWVLVNGQMPHRLDYRSAFLVNLRDGRSVRVDARDTDFGAFTFSRDGKTAAWTHVADARDRSGEVWTQRLDGTGRVNKTRISTSQFVQLVLSDDGSRLATFAGGLLNVADATTGQSLASVRISVPSRPADVSLFFVTPDVVRLYVTSANRPPVPQDLVAPIYEFDVRSRKLEQTGAFRGAGRWLSWAVMPDGQTAILDVFKTGAQDASVCLADARTGTCRSDVDASTRSIGVLPLADGSLVHVVHRDDGSWLYRNGAPPVLIAKTDWAYVAAMSGMKAVVVAAGRDESEMNTAIVDAAAGRIEYVIANVKAARRHPAYEDDPRVAPPGSSNIVAAIDRDGHVVRLDINTGAVTSLPR